MALPSRKPTRTTKAFLLEESMILRTPADKTVSGEGISEFFYGKLQQCDVCMQQTYMYNEIMSLFIRICVMLSASTCVAVVKE